ncbi:MAG: putative 4-hydroxybenzoate polyprenyltransferase [Planctomycetota bacterium]|nr:putative 4-hydroxybenzoate polyprenyltransferase [Planctomycetota bacterium]
MSLARYLSLVKFSHSIFALPFALMGAWLAAGGPPSVRVLGLVVLAAVAARTAAMGFNRVVDRRIDAANPRTQGREIPAGLVSPRGAWTLVTVSSLVFVAASALLNPLCGWLSPLVLAVLLGYSFAKRFTSLVHLWLGLALGLAPPGAWLAVTGSFDGDLSLPLLLGAAVLTWVAGFDIIYSCQDEGFDAERGLHSIPARLGRRGALRLSSLLHVATVLLLAALAWRAELSWIFLIALLAAALLLIWEHSIVSPKDMSRVNMAFFTINGYVGVGLFLGTALDLWLLGGTTPMGAGL